MPTPIKQQGVAILFAILLVSIVLTVSLVLFNITYRQLVLSSLARESQFAFYAADSALNCARHYDSIFPLDQRLFGYYATDPTSHYVYSAGTPTNLDCGVGSFTLAPPNFNSTDYGTFTFVVTYSDGLSPAKQTCASVKVTKYNETASGTLPGKTLIETRGYNNSDPGNLNGCYQVTDRTVERALSVIY